MRQMTQAELQGLWDGWSKPDRDAYRKHLAHFKSTETEPFEAATKAALKVICADEKVLAHPFVRQVIETFDGVVISVDVDERFDGETYDADKDGVRLTGQLLRVYEAMKDGRWHTLDELAEVSGGSEASVSARLRDLRKEKFGSHEVERERVKGEDGLWKYRLVLPGQREIWL